MSVVANVICRFGSWVVSAGRGRDAESDAIVSETVIKTRMVSKRVCVGYTGTFEVADAVLSRLCAPKNQYAIQHSFSDNIANAIFEILQKSTIADGLMSSFLITGQNSAGLNSYLYHLRKYEL